MIHRWPNDYSRPDWLYVVGHPDGLFKVGKSADPKERHSVLEMTSPYRLEPCYACVPEHRVLALENVVHIALKEHHMRAEWFRVPLPKIIETIHDRAKALGVRILQEAEPFEIKQRRDRTIRRLSIEANGYATEHEIGSPA